MATAKKSTQKTTVKKSRSSLPLPLQTAGRMRRVPKSLDISDDVPKPTVITLFNEKTGIKVNIPVLPGEWHQTMTDIQRVFLQNDMENSVFGNTNSSEGMAKISTSEMKKTTRMDYFLLDTSENLSSLERKIKKLNGLLNKFHGLTDPETKNSDDENITSVESQLGRITKRLIELNGFLGTVTEAFEEII